MLAVTVTSVILTPMTDTSKRADLGSLSTSLSKSNVIALNRLEFRGSRCEKG